MKGLEIERLRNLMDWLEKNGYANRVFGIQESKGKTIIEVHIALYPFEKEIL